LFHPDAPSAHPQYPRDARLMSQRPLRAVILILLQALLLCDMALQSAAGAVDTTENVLRPQRQTNDILSPYERFWLREHPQLRIAANTNWPPFEFVDEAGRFQGMVADYLELIQQRIGYQFQTVPMKTWRER